MTSEDRFGGKSDRTTVRTAVFTSRSASRDVFRCGGYEYEDLIVDEFEDGTLVEPIPTSRNQLRFRAKNFLMRQELPGAQYYFGAPTGSLERDVDLFFAYPALPEDLFDLITIHNWRKRAGFAICHLQELWCAKIDKMPAMLKILNQFDHIFCPMYQTVELLQKNLDVPVSYLPWGIDAEASCPYGRNKERVIDVTAIGKIGKLTHQSLYDWAQRTGRYYNYTTTGSAEISVPHTVHRQHLNETLQRSKYFLAFLAKRDVIQQRKTQKEFGLRYFEGAAAGAILLGEPVTENPGYLENLDWEGVVIEAPFSSDQLPQIIEDLERDPSWLDKVRRENVINCLTRHDHLYRWQEVLKVAGLPETPAMAARRARLSSLAEKVRSDAWKRDTTLAMISPPNR